MTGPTANGIAISPAMTSSSPLGWLGARWVGEIDLATLPQTEATEAGAEVTTVPSATIELLDRDGYSTARILVRDAGLVRGFIELPIPDDGALKIAELRSLGEALPAPEPSPPIAGDLPPFTVIICTRDRADLLRVALRSVVELDYPNFEVIVVDNASRTDATKRLIETEFAGNSVTFVSEPVPGLAGARNTGLVHANGEFVAYTDDDVVVDRRWLAELASAFQLGASVGCVSGLVPSGELRTQTQLYFDTRVSWSRNLRQRVFSTKTPPIDLPMFPFCVGEFGTGANFALRRSVVVELRGFDSAFGVGTRTGGGEDIDMFTRILFAGHDLVIHPSAIVWHRHRHDIAALQAQARGYGTGLGAWLTKIALNPKTLGPALAKGRHVVGRVSTIARRTGETKNATTSHDDGTKYFDGDLMREIRRVGLIELLFVARGPFAYARQRAAGAGLMPKPARKSQLRPPSSAN